MSNSTHVPSNTNNFWKQFRLNGGRYEWQVNGVKGLLEFRAYNTRRPYRITVAGSERCICVTAMAQSSVCILATRYTTLLETNPL